MPASVSLSMDPQLQLKFPQFKSPKEPQSNGRRVDVSHGNHASGTGKQYHLLDQSAVSSGWVTIQFGSQKLGKYPEITLMSSVHKDRCIVPRDVGYHFTRNRELYPILNTPQ